MATMAAPASVSSGAYAPGEQTGLWSWLATVDHKRIGTLYLWTALSFLIIGGIEAFIMRLQRPQLPIPPTLPASWRAPICRISTFTLNSEAYTFINSRKSTRPSAI